MKQPNLFTFATKELSQDAFYAWLISWADEKYETVDPNLSQVAKAFVALLLETYGKEDFENEILKTIKITQQEANIDILVTVNNTIKIVIEDKTNSQQHGKQLEEYRKYIEGHYPNPQFRHCFIYLKSGNESLCNRSKIENAGYKMLPRDKILEVLHSVKVENAIFNDYLAHLQKIEDETASCFTTPVKNWNYRSRQGFILALQEKISGDWGDLNNPSGSFMGWWSFAKIKGHYNVQIELHSNEAFPRVLIKRDYEGQPKPSIGQLKSSFEELKGLIKEQGLELMKPKRFTTGKTTATIGHIAKTDIEATMPNGIINLDSFINLYRKLETL